MSAPVKRYSDGNAVKQRAKVGSSLRHRESESELTARLVRMLEDAGYRPASIRRDFSLGGGKWADIALLDPRTNKVRTLIEVKSSARKRLSDRDIVQLQTYLSLVGGNDGVTGILAQAPLGRHPSDTPFEFHQVRNEADRWSVQPLRSLPRAQELLVVARPLTASPPPTFVGSLASERQQLSLIIAHARSAVSRVSVMIDESAAIELEAEWSWWRTTLDTLDLELTYRLADLRIPRPWTSAKALFRNVMRFARTISVAISNKPDTGADHQHATAVRVVPNLNLEGAVLAVLRDLDRNLRSLLLGRNVARELELRSEQISAFINGESIAALPSWTAARDRVPVDLVAITAMKSPEFEELGKILDADDQTNDTPFSSRTSAHCVKGWITAQDGKKRFRVVVATQNQMGMAEAGVLATKLLSHYRPKFIAMVGIAAGLVPPAKAIGDILVSAYTLDLDLGKKTKQGGRAIFKPKVYEQNVKPLFEQFDLIHQAAVDPALANAILVRWNSQNPEAPITTPPQCHVGIFGSGGSVIEDATHARLYRSIHPDLIGFDMEAHAVVTAAAEAGVPGVRPLIAKSICDFADSKKGVNKEANQRFAAFTSANFLREFFLRFVQ